MLLGMSAIVYGPPLNTSLLNSCPLYEPFEIAESVTIAPALIGIVLLKSIGYTENGVGYGMKSGTRLKAYVAAGSETVSVYTSLVAVIVGLTNQNAPSSA